MIARWIDYEIYKRSVHEHAGRGWNRFVDEGQPGAVDAGRGIAPSEGLMRHRPKLRCNQTACEFFADAEPQ